MKLYDTVEMMLSTDYKERFKAEYAQVCIRCESLSDTVMKYESGQLDFVPVSKVSTLSKQLGFMESYKNQLKFRAIIEGIDVSEVDAAFE